jgi:hypothetical protein
MTDADFHRAIQRIRTLHWAQYPVQGLLMAAVVVLWGSRAATGTSTEPRLATWPALLLLVALVPVAGLLLFMISRTLRPNLRRPAQENLRIYQARIFLRNSLLSLVALPMFAAYLFSHSALDLLLGAGMLAALSWRLAPSATTYQRWLIS